MFSGPPLPLPPDFPLGRLVTLTPSPSFGAWLRTSGPIFRLHLRAAGRCVAVMVGGDLGRLLGCCSQVAVREGAQPLVLSGERLIQWRALQVVTGAPYLPGVGRLKQIFPGIDFAEAGFYVPLPRQAPEEVLAQCLVSGIPVAESRIVYRQPQGGPALG